jgi:hypothetical protein
LLVQRLVEVDARPLKASEFWSLLGRIPDPARLLGLDAAAIAALGGIGADDGERIARLLEAAPGFAFQMDELQQGGIRLAAAVDPDYPARPRARLGSTAPPSSMSPATSASRTGSRQAPSATQLGLGLRAWSGTRSTAPNCHRAPG